MKSAIALFVLVTSLSSLASAQAAVPLPTVSGPLPVTADSYPLLAANRVQEDVGLADSGYVEEEYLISGTANIYDWDKEGKLTVMTADAPYATRILVRRPADTAKFSGNVIVEPLNEARGYDWAFVWALSHEHFMEKGDAWVGITHMPQTIAALKTFNPQRYASVSFANPNLSETCGRTNATSDSEEGLHWDIYSQVGALLKSKPTAGPLAGFDVQKLYLTSHHGHAATYAVTVHALAKLADGSPVYDGFLLPSSDTTMHLRRCGAVPGNGDPHQIVRNVGVPVIRIVPQGEVLGAISSRREDSDTPGDRYRLYEIPGAPRMDRIYFVEMPVVEDQLKAGQPASIGKWPYNYQCAPDQDLLDFPIKRYVSDAAFDNLDAWVRKGTAPPRAERIAVENPGTPEAAFTTDSHGNAQGGVRHTYVTVPAATYSGNGPGACRSIATRTPFDWATMRSLYESPQKYAGQVKASLDTLVAQHWFTANDARRIRDSLLEPAIGK